MAIYNPVYPPELLSVMSVCTLKLFFIPLKAKPWIEMWKSFPHLKVSKTFWQNSEQVFSCVWMSWVFRGGGFIYLFAHGWISWHSCTSVIKVVTDTWLIRKGQSYRGETSQIPLQCSGLNISSFIYLFIYFPGFGCGFPSCYVKYKRTWNFKWNIMLNDTD